MNRAVFTLLLSLAIAACGRRGKGAPGARAEGPVPVRVAPVTLEEVARPLTATGTLGPKEEVPLSFKVGGGIAPP